MLPQIIKYFDPPPSPFFSSYALKITLSHSGRLHLWMIPFDYFAESNVPIITFQKNGIQENSIEYEELSFETYNFSAFLKASLKTEFISNKIISQLSFEI